MALAAIRFLQDPDNLDHEALQDAYKSADFAGNDARNARTEIVLLADDLGYDLDLP